MKLWVYLILFVMATHMFIVHSRLIKAGSRWQAEREINNTPQNNNQPSCLKVSDFYSVHLTIYFQPTPEGGDIDPKDRAKQSKQVCDRIPGKGWATFAVDLMEQDARNTPVALTLSRYDKGGQLVPVKELPPAVHQRGVLTMDTAIAEKGKYLLKVAFGEAKSKDDIIEMPVMAGQ